MAAAAAAAAHNVLLHDVNIIIICRCPNVRRSVRGYIGEVLKLQDWTMKELTTTEPSSLPPARL